MSGFTCVISGRCAKGGVATKMFIISAAVRFAGDIVPEDAKKEDLVVYVEGPDKNIRLNIMANAKAVYHIGFTPREAGQYWIDFVFRGEWAEKPYMFEISDAFNRVPNFPYQGIYRNSPQSAMAFSQETTETDKELKIETEQKAEEDRIQAEKVKIETEKKAEAEKVKIETEKKAEEERLKSEAEKARIEKEKKDKVDREKKGRRGQTQIRKS